MFINETILTLEQREALVSVAYVNKAHGLKGYLKLTLFSGNPERFKTYKTFFACDKQGKSYFLTRDKVTVTPAGLLVKFSGIDDRDAAEQCIGWEVLVEKSQLSALAEGEFYYNDLLGLDVYDQSGLALGELKEIIETGANDVYSVVAGKQEILIPALKNIIISIDLASGRMVVNPPEGLLDCFLL